MAHDPLPWTAEGYTGGAFLVNWGKYAEELGQQTLGQAVVSDRRPMTYSAPLGPIGDPSQWGPAVAMPVPNLVAQLAAENTHLKEQLKARDTALARLQKLTNDLFQRATLRQRLSAGWESQPCVTTGASQPQPADALPARALRHGWAG